MDQEIRNKLRNVVTQCRKLLEEAVSQVLEGQFGIFATRRMRSHVEAERQMKHLTEEDKGYRQGHSGSPGPHQGPWLTRPKDALAQLVREIAFTHLNRLCAYKMMEAREV